MSFEINKVDALDVSRWYVIHTHPLQEDRADLNLKSWKVETFNPRLRECRYNQFTGKPVYRSKPLFPRYLFARFNAKRLLHNISFTRGVESVVGFSEGPVPVDDGIIEIIKERIGDDGFVRLGEELQPGDHVEINDGPFRSLTGIFQREIKGTDRVMILLASISYQGRIIISKGLLKKVV